MDGWDGMELKLKFSSTEIEVVDDYDVDSDDNNDN